MHENYFKTLGDYAKTEELRKRLLSLKQDLDIWHANCRWTEDPKLDRLRRDTKALVEELYDGLVEYSSKEEHRLYDKLSDSENVINLHNLFKN